MIPLVVMMFLQIVIPPLELVRSEFIDEMKLKEHGGNVVQFDHNLAIVGTFFCLTVGFYFLLIIYAGWQFTKNE